MNLFVRCFVICLLVLALPVQGFAAATMLLCEGGHDRVSHMHESMPDAPALTATAGDDHEGLASSPMSAKHAKVVGKCGTCAACCTVVFLPSNIIAFTAPAPSRALPVVELTTRVGFFTDGPDRPPRPRFA